MRKYTGWGAGEFKAGVTLDLDTLRQNNEDIYADAVKAHIVSWAAVGGQSFSDSLLNVTDIGGVEEGQLFLVHSDIVRPGKEFLTVEVRYEGQVQVYFCDHGLSDSPTVLTNGDYVFTSGSETTDTESVSYADLGLAEGDEYTVVVYVNHPSTLYRLLVVET